MQGEQTPHQFLVRAISELVTEQLVLAVAQGRWVDDFLVLEMAKRIEKRFPGEIDAETSRKIVYKCLANASEHIDLGLKKTTIQQLNDL